MDLRYEIERGYARGWSFTPLNGKRPIWCDWQARERLGLPEALAWARQHNMGLRTGQASQIAVVDIDAAATIRPSDLPATVTALTGSGRGWHLYYRPAGPVGNRMNTLIGPTGEKLRFVDLRGDGGQVVFVGGRHDSGLRYVWSLRRGPDDLPVAPLPGWLVDRPKPTCQVGKWDDVSPGQAERRCMAYLGTLQPAVSGAGGHNATFLAAATCWRFGLTREAVVRCMQWFNLNRCRPEWSEKELAHKIESAGDHVARQGEIGFHLARE